jgi:hypothetical protein
LFGKGRAKTGLGKHPSTKPPLTSTFAEAVCYAHFVFVLSEAARRGANQIFGKEGGFGEGAGKTNRPCCISGSTGGSSKIPWLQNLGIERIL